MLRVAFVLRSTEVIPVFSDLSLLLLSLWFFIFRLGFKKYAKILHLGNVICFFKKLFAI